MNNLMTIRQITDESVELFKQNNSVTFGCKYIRPVWLVNLVEEKQKFKQNNWLYLFELFVGKAAVVGFKSTFSLYNKAI